MFNINIIINNINIIIIKIYNDDDNNNHLLIRSTSEVIFNIIVVIIPITILIDQNRQIHYMNNFLVVANNYIELLEFITYDRT